MKNYLKVAQRKTLTGPPVSGPTPSTDFPVTAALPPATIPSPGQDSTSSYSPTATRRPIKPHVLQAKPATIGELSQSTAKVGTAIPLVYPLIAKKNEWEGTVRVRVVVQPSGFPETIRIQKSSGHNVLDNAAVEALRKTRFIPAKDGNIPVRSIVEIPIKFDLKNPT
jgi:protein TonB